MRKFALVLGLSFALVLLFGGVAYANFGAHGGFATDTDSCAGCHRAHTSFSTLTWTDPGNNHHSSLLISSATTMGEFCYACHGDGAPGASTNVVAGVFDAGPTSGVGSPGGSYAYESNSVFGSPLNGGGFVSAPKTALNDVAGTQQSYIPATSMHSIDQGTGTDPMWGAGTSLPAGKNLTCTDCHDPHGSSNYRALKDVVNGVAVGGYTGTDGETPNPLVWSAEEGYPGIGWLKHSAGAAQMAAYKPNYTAAQYKWSGIAPSLDPAGEANVLAGQYRSISTWCAACHQAYDNKASAYDYGEYERGGMSGTVSNGLTSTDGTSTDTIGNRARHRHPVNISIVAGVGPTRALQQEVIASAALPLEYTNADSSVAGPDGPWTTDDYLGCLTCHRAHGVSSDMTGWAEARYVTNPSAVVTWYPEPLAQGTTGIVSGVNPNFSSALLRADNRGVCERCHNK